MKPTKPVLTFRFRKIPFSLGAILFFVCFYLYIWLFVEPCLIYHGYGMTIAYPEFWVDSQFLNDSLSYPGGMVEYLAAFLSQLYYYSWLGALVITAIAWLMYLGAAKLLSLSGTKQLNFLGYIPAVILFMIHHRYDNQLTCCIAMLLIIWLFYLYERIFRYHRSLRAAFFWATFALLYYLAAEASIIFAIMVLIYEIFIGRSRMVGLSSVGAVLGTFLVCNYAYNIKMDIVHYRSLIYQPHYDLMVKYFVIGLSCCLPLFLLIACFGQRVVAKKASHGKARKGHKSARKNRSFPANLSLRIVKVSLLTAVVLAGFLISYNDSQKKRILIDYLACRKDWSGVLETAGRLKPQAYDHFCIHDVNRALFYTDRLSDEMFRFPQKLSALFLVNVENEKNWARNLLKRSRIFLEFGDPGFAEKEAFEYMELVGHSPLVIEQLARIKMVQGQVETAKIFLGALSRDLIFGARARRMLTRLAEDPQLDHDEKIRHLRSVATQKDFTEFSLSPDFFFQDLLDRNSSNKLVFEYMMAFNLLTGNKDGIVDNIWRLDSLGYQKLPRYYEEAIVIYIVSQRPKKNLHGWQPRSETIMQAKKISETCRLYGGRQNEQKIRDALSPEFDHSYFLYYVFEVSNAKKRL